MDLVVMVLLLAPQVYQVFPGAQDRGIHGHRGTTRSTRFNGTTRGQRRHRKAGKPRPLRSTGTSRKNGTSRVHKELKVTQEIKEAREPQALRDLRDLQELWGEIGNSVFSKL